MDDEKAWVWALVAIGVALLLLATTLVARDLLRSAQGY